MMDAEVDLLRAFFEVSLPNKRVNVVPEILGDPEGLTDDIPEVGTDRCREQD